MYSLTFPTFLTIIQKLHHKKTSKATFWKKVRKVGKVRTYGVGDTLVKNIGFIAFCLLIAVANVATAAADLTGKVVGVHDGDTLTLLVAGNQQRKVRLGEIDTPELAQPYGSKAKQALSDLVFGREARVVVQDIDRYGRTVGRVYVGAVDVNAELVKQGAAWVYRQYLRDQSLLPLEAQAQAAKAGLWALQPDQRLPPWDWRRQEKSAKTSGNVEPPPSAAVPAAAFSCGSKRTCSQMETCDEAKFYLTTCGVRSLDGDGDGQPCEKLCR